METQQTTKYCKHCGAQIPADAVICTACGRQVEQLNNGAAPQVVINNSNTNTNVNTNTNINGRMSGRRCNKWVSFSLCLLLGFFGAHKFYEGKTGMGIVYILTGGLFGIGWIIDIIAILMKPNPYYV